jgi:hypothetical protein
LRLEKPVQRVKNPFPRQKPRVQDLENHRKWLTNEGLGEKSGFQAGTARRAAHFITHARRGRKPDKVFGIIFGGARIVPIRSGWPDRYAPGEVYVIGSGEGAASWDNSRSEGGRHARGGVELFYRFDDGHFDGLAGVGVVGLRSEEKRRRAAALQDATAFTDDFQTARSVLECASPLALWEGGRHARGGVELFCRFDGGHFSAPAARNLCRKTHRRKFKLRRSDICREYALLRS